MAALLREEVKGLLGQPRSDLAEALKLNDGRIGKGGPGNSK